jgi:hypothetical protein
MTPSEFTAGPDQTIVVYVSPDTGTEVDPVALYAEIAEDAARRAGSGERIVSMAAVPIRHTGLFLGREGSGYESKIAVAVIFGRA